MAMIGSLCAVPRPDCDCYRCQTARLEGRLSRVVLVLRWYQGIEQQMGRPEELDDYHRGYYDALRHLLRDFGDAVADEK